MGVIWLILGIIITADALGVGLSYNFNIGEFVTMAVGMLMIIYGANHKKIKSGKGFFRLYRYLMRLMMVYIIGMSAFLCAYGTFSTVNYNEDYAIVLGGGIINNRPTEGLKSRLDAAAEYHSENPDAVIIVSGGQGNNEITAEANVMYDYLAEKGVNADVIVKESEANNTYENYKLSNLAVNNKLTDSSTVTITNDYHMFRSTLYASMCGINTHTLSAPTKLYLIPVSYIRESFAMIKMLVYYLPMDKFILK